MKPLIQSPSAFMLAPLVMFGALVNYSALAQEVPDPEAVDTDTVLRQIEEITVIGQRTLARMRLQIEQKQSEIYDFFNANNSDDRFDILCRKYRPTGSVILVTECEPRFLRNLRVQRTRDLRLGLGVDFTQRELVEISAREFDELEQEMLELMSAHPEFADTLAELAILTENFEAARAEYFEGN